MSLVLDTISLEDFIQGVDKVIRVDAVSHCTFFKAFGMGDCATNAPHARQHQGLDDLRILADDVGDQHIFGDHINALPFLIKQKNDFTRIISEGNTDVQ